MARQRTCKYCKIRHNAESGIVVNMSSYCNFECAANHAIDKSTKARNAKLNKIKKDERAYFRKRKEAIKPLTKVAGEAQSAINAWVRYRDRFSGCISCNATKQEIEFNHMFNIGGAWDAGHFQSRGAKKQLRFNLWNIHKQCKKCNGGSGRFSHKEATVSKKYEENLIKKIGLEKVEYLKNNNQLATYDADYCRRLKNIFKKKLRLAKKINGD